MKKHGTVQILTSGQMKELISSVTEAIPVDLNPEVAQKWIGSKKKLSFEIKKLLSSDAYADLIADWERFYQGMGMKVDFSNVRIPKKRKGFDRLIIRVHRGLTPQKFYDKCKELFPCRKWTNISLDEVTDLEKSERKADTGPYAIWVRDRIEADKELKNLSAIQIQEKNITTETFEERFLHELKFFKETGEHLDIENWTLCSGSCHSDGHVPRIGWNANGWLVVHWSYPDLGHSDLRAREVVSC